MAQSVSLSSHKTINKDTGLLELLSQKVSLSGTILKKVILKHIPKKIPNSLLIELQKYLCGEKQYYKSFTTRNI